MDHTQLSGPAFLKPLPFSFIPPPGKGMLSLDRAVPGLVLQTVSARGVLEHGVPLGLQGSAVGNGCVTAAVAGLRATPVRVAVCVCMGLGGQGSSSLYYAEPGCWTEFCGVESLPQPMTAEVSWEAGAFPQGQGRTPENGAAQYSGSMWKIPFPRTLGQLLSTED